MMLNMSVLRYGFRIPVFIFQVPSGIQETELVHDQVLQKAWKKSNRLVSIA